MIFPARAPLAGAIGREQGFRRLRYQFFPSDGIELYRALDWVREIEP